MANSPPRVVRQSRTWVGAALVVALPIALAASGAPMTLTSGQTHRGDAGWSSEGWMGEASALGGTTLAQVRTAIGAGPGTTAAGLTGAGVGVALIDTGVANIPGLPAAQLRHGPDLSFESQSAALRYQDTFGHGTHMAGIIIGDDPTTGTVGIAPKAKLTSIKVGINNGTVDVTQVIAAIDWVVAHRADDAANPIKVINLSYGSGSTSTNNYDPFHRAVENAWKSGIVVVVSAGNDGNKTAYLASPARDPAVIAVGASTTKGTVSTADDELTAFTNLSTSSRLPDVLAPGQSVVSLRDSNSMIDRLYPGGRGDGVTVRDENTETLFRGSGTSQAAAVVSGAVALLLQKRPTLTPDQVKQVIKGGGSAILPGLLGSTQKLTQLNMVKALTIAPTTNALQSLLSAPNILSSVFLLQGYGSIEASRGGRGGVHVVRDGKELSGEVDIMGAFSSSTYWGKSPGTQWVKGVWMGDRMAGDGWTGTSWGGSPTWASTVWATRPWSGDSIWSDRSWEGRYWANGHWEGRYWADAAWEGRYWADAEWSTAQWG